MKKDIAIFFQGTNTALMFYNVETDELEERLILGQLIALLDESGNKVIINPNLIQFIRIKEGK